MTFMIPYLYTMITNVVGAHRDTLSARSPSSAPRPSVRLTPQTSGRTMKPANKAAKARCTLVRPKHTPGNRQG